MKRNILCTIISIVCSLTLYAQHPIGSWQVYLSYHNTTYSEPAGTKVYALGNNGLYSYDTDDSSVKLYQKGNPLSDTEISQIAYRPEYKTLLIIYSNGNIDLLINDKDIYNLPDYMNKNMSQNKKVNHIYFAEEYAYLSTKFGVLVINLKRKEINNTYILNKNINACVIENSNIYAASTEGLYTAVLTDNLLDINNWKMVSDANFKQLSLYNGELLGNILSNGICIINKDNYSYSQLINGYYTYMNVYKSKLLAGNNNTLVIFDDLNKRHYLNHQLNVSHFSLNNGIYWGSQYDNGLTGFKYNEQSNAFELTVSSINPNSPKRNLPYYLKIENEKLLVAGGGIIYDRFNEKGTIMAFENNTWTSFQEEGIKEITNVDYRDISSIVQDPNDENHHFAGSVGEGLYEFQNGKFVNLYTIDNSNLESASSKDPYHFIRVNGLIYDNDNNLWMLNCAPGKTIHILKNNKTWVSLNHSEMSNRTNLEHTIFDRRGWLWATSAWQTDYGVFCVNTNGTLEDSSDDHHKFVSNFTNQDGTVLTHGSILCIVEDKNGAIWIGTGQGPIVLNNPANFFEDNFYCTQIKIPRNDGTNLADFLLANDIINAIAVDGGNRKWIGTEGSGLYLLSPDGLETIHHFTEDNSPLLSNSIQSIAIHPRTGEVFIGTSKGLVSYQSDAIEAKDSFVKDDVYAYPNPVKPDYTGVITVTGLVQDTDVKITNVSGKLIYSGTSVGGQFTWDGKNLQGNKVPSGIYFVLAADSQGKEGIATKILFIR